MNLHTYKAVVARLQADGLAAAARINLLLNQEAGGAAPSGDIVEEICAAMRHLTESEGALITFQQYFGPPATPVPQPAPAAPPPEPEPDSTSETTLRLTEDELNKRSPTHRKTGATRRTKKTKKTNEQE